MKQPSNAIQIHFEIRCDVCKRPVWRDGETIVTHIATQGRTCICHTCAQKQNFSNQPLKLDDEREN